MPHFAGISYGYTLCAKVSIIWNEGLNGQGLVFIKILGHSLKYDQLFIKSDYSLFINVFLYSLKIELFIILDPHYSLLL